MSSINAENITVTNLNVEYINGYPASSFSIGTSSSGNPCEQTDPTCDDNDAGCPECLELPTSCTGAAGATGATGATGAQGPQGISSGLVLYLNMSEDSTMNWFTN